MLYNGRFFVHGFLFILFVFATLNGITILWTNSFRKPFTRDDFVEGWKANIVGLLLICVGISSLVTIFVLLS